MKEPTPLRKGIKRQLLQAQKNVRKEIAANAKGGKYAAGLASEGYAGGYRDAIMDALQAMGGHPNHQSRFWPAPKG